MYKNTPDDILQILKKHEKKHLDLPLKERLKVAGTSIILNLKVRKFYKPFWFLSVLNDAILLILKKPNKKINPHKKSRFL